MEKRLGKGVFLRSALSIVAFHHQADMHNNFPFSTVLHPYHLPSCMDPTLLSGAVKLCYAHPGEKGLDSHTHCPISETPSAEGDSVF